MFPEQITGPVTIWPRHTNPETGEQVNMRCVLRGCFWNEDSIGVWQRTGEQTTNSVTLFIPYASETTGLVYATPDEWNALAPDALAGRWTADPRNLPLMAQGASDHEFVPALPNAANRISVQESTFLTANHAARRAKDINVQFFGSPDMHHIQIRT